MPLCHVGLRRTEDCSKAYTGVQVKTACCLIWHFTKMARFNPWTTINGNRLKSFDLLQTTLSVQTNSPVRQK